MEEFNYYEFEYHRCLPEYDDEDEEDDCYNFDGDEVVDFDDIKHFYLQDYRCKVEEIHGYGDFEDQIKNKSGRRSRFFGTELEIEFDCSIIAKARTAEYTAMEIQDVLEISIPCYDGSIAKGVDNRAGFEIKTRPDNIENTLKELKSVCDFALKHKRGFYGHETDGRCGFHVHVSRASLSPSQEVKLYLFMHDVSNRKLIKAVMRRYDVSYATTRVITTGVISELLIPSAKDGRVLNRFRSECLNFTSKTLEFRGGRSTLKIESLQVTLEFINALLAFTAPATVGIKNRNSEGFIAWLQTQHGFKTLKNKIASSDLARK